MVQIEINDNFVNHIINRIIESDNFKRKIRNIVDATLYCQIQKEFDKGYKKGFDNGVNCK